VRLGLNLSRSNLASSWASSMNVHPFVTTYFFRRAVRLAAIKFASPDTHLQLHVYRLRVNLNFSHFVKGDERKG
ncbi:MAG: hypothetical protein ACK40X_04150, partial [Armatimonadota bacterium]